MSGAARARGRGRGAPPDEPSEPTSPRGSSQRRSSRRGRRSRIQPGGFDGPASRGSASGVGSQGRRLSNPPSVSSGPSGTNPPQEEQPTSRRSSVSTVPLQAETPIHKGDPAKEESKRFTDQMKNIDLPASFYNIDGLYALPTEFKHRPGFNNTGKAITLSLNAYTVAQFPNVNIFQYDVTIGNGSEKRAVQRMVWNSKARKTATGPAIIYDGNRLAWSMVDHNEIRLMVDLDADQGRPPRGDKNTFRLHIKRTRQLDVGIIQQYLSGRIQMSIQVAEAIMFMDHLLREGPSNNDRLFPVKRSFFARGGQRSDLGGYVEVYRGVYQSLRLAEGQKLIINLDVANSCFWKPGNLVTALVQNRKLRDPQHLANEMRPDNSKGNGHREISSFTKVVQSLIKSTTVKASYQGNKAPEKEWKIYKVDINNAQEEMIEYKLPNSDKPPEKISIAAYFMRKYNLRLQYPLLPVIEMTKKKVKFPMELLIIQPNQRYGVKLDETQTANMIKFAVSPPKTRLDAINEGKTWLNWQSDTHLQKYGLKIDPTNIRTNARLLPPPTIKFGSSVETPGLKGRWDLRGKKFLTPNPQELVSWGIGVFKPSRGPAPDKAAIEKFAADFARMYRGHGGKVSNRPPYIVILPDDAGQAVEKLHQETGNNFQRRPQLMIFLVPDKNAFHYTRIKKSSDCRYGVVSQVLQLNQVLRGSPQYYSNVLMKVNAKLGGCTSQSIPSKESGFKGINTPTMFIGADVSHASPGSLQSSMAAVSVSFDKHAGRYAAACQTNGHRVEMIAEANMRSMLGPLFQKWATDVGGGRYPEHVYYFRDGVSEGQFSHVMKQEVPHIKAILSEAIGSAWNGKVTVIIASKRHHVRAFPKPGDPAADQKGNPVPGCLIERDVTMPNEFDFYLYSHIALQGTSRPVHYTILHDDTNQPPGSIQNMIYEHCYQYMRSTTSVSLHPAVYYAHLASNRAKAHEDVPATKGPQGGAGYKQNIAKEQKKSSDPPPSEAPPLLPMYNVAGIQHSMWYI